MINEESLMKMYDGILNNSVLTTKKLNEYGFHAKDISDLIKEGKLQRLKRGYYSLLSIDDLFYYGKRLISMKEYEKATKCFLTCYQLNPQHLGSCFQLFLRSIQSKNYEKAFEYFEHFYESENENYNHDSNYYLYLLNIITELPEHHREYARYLKLSDISANYNDKRYSNHQLYNKIRISSLNQRFVLALRQLNEAIHENNGIITVQDIVVKTLLTQAIEKQQETKKRIIKLINEKKYDEVIQFLQNMDTKHGLSRADQYTLVLIKDLTKIIKTGEIPKKQIFSTDKVLDAIEGKNYELAFQLSLEYLKKSNINSDDNALYLLLSEIQNLMNMHKEISQVVEQQVVEEIESHSIKKSEEQPIQVQATNSFTDTNTFADIIGYLMKEDLDNAFTALRNYLCSINKSQYEFLIIDLIKISLIEGDIAFTKPMISLTYITRENFEFNISEYIQKFYENLANNNFEHARIYLDIISKANKLGQSCILTESLERVLNDTEKMQNYKRNNDVISRVDDSIENISEFTSEGESYADSTSTIPSKLLCEQPAIENIVMPKDGIDTNHKATPPKKTYDDYDLIQQKLDEVYEKGIIVLKPMNDGRRKEIHNIVKNIPDVVSFSIGASEDRRVVLRFKPYIYEHIDIKQMTSIGNEAYKNGDYDTCINSYRQLLELKEPKAFIYAKLGLAYMKKFDKNTAIDYFTVATELSKKENGMYDFTELIASLNGLISQEDKKPLVRMQTSDFKDDIDEYYGIDGIDQVAKLISSGMTIEEACCNLRLNEEQKNIVTLIYAREYYAQEFYALGDQYLKKVERTKNKSKFVITLLEEIRKNKRFYKNRMIEEAKHLTFTSETQN